MRGIGAVARWTHEIDQTGSPFHRLALRVCSDRSSAKWSRTGVDAAQSGSLPANYRDSYWDARSPSSKTRERTILEDAVLLRGGESSLRIYVIRLRFVIIINTGDMNESYVKWNLRGNRDWGRSLLGRDDYKVI